MADSTSQNGANLGRTKRKKRNKNKSKNKEKNLTVNVNPSTSGIENGQLTEDDSKICNLKLEHLLVELHQEDKKILKLEDISPVRRNSDRTQKRFQNHKMKVKHGMENTDSSTDMNHFLKLNEKWSPQVSNELNGLHLHDESKFQQIQNNNEPAFKKSVLKKKELEKRLLKWKEFFQNNKEWFIILDFHSIVLLRTIRDKTPRAQFYCNNCSYYCDNLEVVRNHMKDQRHLLKLHNSLIISTTIRVPCLSKKICDILTDTLENYVLEHVMTSCDVKQRCEFVKFLNNFISEKIPGCGLRIFGSSLHGMGLKSSDINIDLVVEPNNHGPSTLDMVGNLLETEVKICKQVKKNFTADVDIPHISFQIETSGGGVIDCIISLNNEKPYKLSLLLEKYALIDGRARKLCALFRLWGKLCCIDKQAEGTWPAYSFYLLVIFFLQQIQVLPVLHEFTMDKENSSPDNYADPQLVMEHWRSNNHENLGILWLKMLRFYAVDFDCAQRLVSIQQSSPLLRKHKSWGGKRIAIVDPFLPKRNITRSICHDTTYEFIMHCLHTTYLYYSIPQTAEGPIFGHVRPDVQIDDLGLTDVPTYIKKQKFLEGLIVKLIISTDSNYYMDFKCNGKVDGVNVNDVLRRLEKDNFVNLTNFDLSPFWNWRGDKQKPFGGKYKELILFTSDAHQLIIHTNPKVIVYHFSSSSFTSGKIVPLSCPICQKDGHTKANCPEEILPELEGIPPLNDENIFHLNKLCEIVNDMSMPTNTEINLRYDIVKELEDIIVHLYPNAKLTLFGSSCNGFGLKGSDLDICLTFSDNLSGKDLDTPHFIENLCSDLRKQSKFQRLVCIPSAKVPIIKFVHGPSMLEGDISLYNTLALENTKLLWTYSKIDRRVQVLGYMIKRFAKLCNIGYASKGSLSSYSYTLMAIFFLQKCNPPVLPVLQELSDNPNGEIPIKLVDNFNTYFYSNLKTLESVWPSKGKNIKSAGELWIELLKFYTEEFDLTNLVISIRSSETITKFSKLWVSKCIAIEDPFDLNHNLGSALSRKMNIYIIKAFRKGRLHFSQHVNKDLSTDIHYINYYFNPKVLADVEPPNDRGCHFCKSIGHKSLRCPEKPSKRKEKEAKEPSNISKNKIDIEKGISNITTPKNPPIYVKNCTGKSEISIKNNSSTNYPNMVARRAQLLPSTQSSLQPPISPHSSLDEKTSNAGFIRNGNHKCPPGFKSFPWPNKNKETPNYKELVAQREREVKESWSRVLGMLQNSAPRVTHNPLDPESTHISTPSHEHHLNFTQ